MIHAGEAVRDPEAGRADRGPQRAASSGSPRSWRKSSATARCAGIAQDVFRQLQDKAKIEIVWNEPAQRARMPGVAATVDGTQITIRELAEECIARHGQEVLEGVIGRKILEQACKRQNISRDGGGHRPGNRPLGGLPASRPSPTARPTLTPGWSWSRRNRACRWTFTATTWSGRRWRCKSSPATRSRSARKTFTRVLRPTSGRASAAWPS